MTQTKRPLDWYNAALDAWTLTIETPAVIALRLAKIGAGNDSGGHEMRRMVTEKAAAVAKLQWALLSGKFGKNPALASMTVLREVSTAVEANRRRLS
jgi:hypothetical protein